jgi:hypothetical protein
VQHTPKAYEMTTTVIVHNSHRKVRIVTEEQVFDRDKETMTDKWRVIDTYDLMPCALFQAYCTETRRLIISEPPITSIA